jgi:dTDP-4-amino-4,6-dideoxygalactose transaminase
LLRVQLPVLDAQNALRSHNAALLDKRLWDQGFRPQATTPGTTGRTYFGYAVAVPDDLVGVSTDSFAAAVTAELGLPVRGIYPVLHRNRLYAPASRRRFALGEQYLQRLDTTRFDVPVSVRAAERFLTFHHAPLLGDESDADDIAQAFEKVLRHSASLREA